MKRFISLVVIALSLASVNAHAASDCRVKLQSYISKAKKILLKYNSNCQDAANNGKLSKKAKLCSENDRDAITDELYPLYNGAYSTCNNVCTGDNKKLCQKGLSKLSKTGINGAMVYLKQIK
jgi:hypothetical protein